MKQLKENGGFTLLELVIAMATGVLIFMAASTILLLGLRINNLTTGTIIRQNTTSTMMKLLDRLATEGKIDQVISDGDSWEIYLKREGETVTRGVINFKSETQEICTGTANGDDIIWDTNNPFMKGVYASNLVIDDKGVLTLAVETEDGSYSSSIFCRNLALPDRTEDDHIDQDTTAARKAFMDTLYSQYRMKGGQPNPGVILDSGISTGQYYSEWYIGAGQWNTNGWNKDTPWCACYISWALTQNTVSPYLDEPEGRSHWYANVDEFMTYFRSGAGTWTESNPQPGDIVFFDWLMGSDPSHVGVVLSVSDDGNLYTIEGNSAGMIAVRQYSLSDKRIIGYGVLPWNAG